MIVDGTKCGVPMAWSFCHIWNQTLEAGRADKPLFPRNHIWAGELGGPYLDRYLKMTAVVPSNPPNARAKRKFEAGNLMEWIVKLVLTRAGILQQAQEWVSSQVGETQITGYLDFQAGGHPDYEKALHKIDLIGLPDFFGRAARAIIEHLRKEYPDGLREILLECKSCASMMLTKYQSSGPDRRHALQLYHYLRAKEIQEGHLVYISRDDLLMEECLVPQPAEPWETRYCEDAATMHNFLQAKQRPPLEEEVFFDWETNKFSKNWRVEYSNYLTMLYGYAEPIDYRDRWDKPVAQWNRVVGRVAQGKQMTKLNLEVLAAIRLHFPRFDAEIADPLRKLFGAGTLEMEEEDNED